MEVNVEDLKVPEIQKEVYDVTSNEPRGGSELAEIAQATKKFDRHGSLSAIKEGEILKNGSEDRECFQHDGFIVTYTPKTKVRVPFIGTTIISGINTTGLYFVVDGLSFEWKDSNTKKKMRKLRKEDAYLQDSPKLFSLGNDMLAAVHGTNVWYEYIIEYLRPKVIYKFWTPLKCAIKTCKILKKHVFSPDDLKKWGLPQDCNMRGEECGIVFGSYVFNKNKVAPSDPIFVPSMYYANNEDYHEILDVHLFGGNSLNIYDNLGSVGYTSHGAGAADAYEILLNYSFFPDQNDNLDKEARAIENGNMTTEEHAWAFLKAMRSSTKNPMTGGIITSKYIGPLGITDLHDPVHEDDLDTAIGVLRAKVDEVLLRIEATMEQ